ncbi:MAG: right-handed parallel beta-helix repeat-containing protein, partial [Chloroflexota bacterium]|nr:right-handed parallel beta-helix repeat-containing protein [Chloroflexota bacterium]
MVVARMSRYLSVSVALAVALLLLVGVAPLPVRAVSHAVAVTLNDTSPGLVGGNSDVIHNPGCATTGTGICSLRDAVIFANAQAVGDTTTITLPAGTYTLTITGAGEDRAMTGDLDLRRNVVIAGAGAGTTIVQASPTDSASGIDRVFDVGAFGDATSATFSGVTIRHGNSVGGADGGSILVETSGSSLTLNDCVVADNQTSRNGGGISVTGGATLVLNRTTVSGNITTSTYIVNGGGIFNAGTVTVTNSTFSGNHADSDGGGGIANSGGTLTVMNSTFAGNSGSPGGGIRNDGGTLTVTNSTFSGNSASAGGGIWNYGGTPTVTSSTFAANTATGGGGIDDESGTLTATNTLIADNTATGGHGPDASADFAVNSKNNLLGIADNYTAGISNGVNGNL